MDAPINLPKSGGKLVVASLSDGFFFNRPPPDFYRGHSSNRKLTRSLEMLPLKEQSSQQGVSVLPVDGQW